MLFRSLRIISVRFFVIFDQCTAFAWQSWTIATFNTFAFDVMTHSKSVTQSRRLPANCVDSNSTNFVTVVAVVCGSYRRNKRRYASNSSGSPAFRTRSVGTSKKTFNYLMNSSSSCTSAAQSHPLTCVAVLCCSGPHLLTWLV